MIDARAIKATFSTWRPVNGRKVLQLVFEVPIEQQGEVLTMLGAPDDKWCAIALLNLKPTEDSLGGHHPPLSTVPRPQANEAGISKPKERFEDLPLVKQCVLRCGDEGFLKFFNAVHGMDEPIADAVRRYCGVASRSEIKTGSIAATRWLGLEHQYQNWLTDQKYGAVRR